MANNSEWLSNFYNRIQNDCILTVRRRDRITNWVTDRFHEVQARVACSNSISGFFDVECAVVVCNSGGIDGESRLGCVPMFAALSQNQAAAGAALRPAGISVVFPSRKSLVNW